MKNPGKVFLEIGPGQTLITLARQHANFGNEQVAISSLRHPKQKLSDVAFILDSLGQFWASGGRIDWDEFYATEQRLRVPLPTYPFERQRYWVDHQISGDSINTQEESTGRKAKMGDWFYSSSWKQKCIPLPINENSQFREKLCWLIFGDESHFSQNLKGPIITVRARDNLRIRRRML